LKAVTMIIRQSSVSRVFPSGLRLSFGDDASILDVINAVDQMIREKCGEFPVKGFKCLMEMVYHPIEGRFYNQVAVQAYAKSGMFLSVRENPRMPIPDEATIILVPEGGCATDWEEPVR